MPRITSRLSRVAATMLCAGLVVGFAGPAHADDEDGHFSSHTDGPSSQTIANTETTT